MPNNIETFTSLSKSFHERIIYGNISSCSLRVLATKPFEFTAVDGICDSSPSECLEKRVEYAINQGTQSNIDAVSIERPMNLNSYSTEAICWDPVLYEAEKDKTTLEDESQLALNMNCFVCPVRSVLMERYVNPEFYLNGISPEQGKIFTESLEKSDSFKRWKGDMSKEIPPCEDSKILHLQNVHVIGRKGEGLGYFEEPTGLTSNSQGLIAVSDYNNDRLQVFSSTGNFVRAYDFYAHGESRGKQICFISPTGLAFDPYGNVVVVEKGRNRISVLSPAGIILCSFGRYGSGQAEFRGPHGVSVDEMNRIIVTDTINCRVQVFDHEGHFLFAFGDKGKGKLNYPCYAIFYSEQFLVSDTDNDAVKVFDSQGTFLHKFGNDRADFKAPSGIAVYKNKCLLVCDYSNDCVKAFSLDGQYLSKFGSSGHGPGQFMGPEAITVTPSGQIVVSDKLNCRLQIFRCTFST